MRLLTPRIELDNNIMNSTVTVYTKQVQTCTTAGNNSGKIKFSIHFFQIYCSCIQFVVDGFFQRYQLLFIVQALVKALFIRFMAHLKSKDFLYAFCLGFDNENRNHYSNRYYTQNLLKASSFIKCIHSCF